MDRDYTEAATNALQLAEQHARELQHRYLGNEHLLLGLLTEDQGRAAWILHTHNVDDTEIRDRIQIAVGTGPTESPPTLPPTAELQRTLIAATTRAALRGNDALIDTDDLLVPILTGHPRSLALRVLIWPRANPGLMARKLDHRRRYEAESGAD